MSVSKLIKDDKKPVEINLALWVILYLPRLFFLEVIFKELKRAHTQKGKKSTTAKTPKINQHCYISSLRESISGGITEIGKNYKTDEGFISLKSSPLFVCVPFLHRTPLCPSSQSLHHHSCLLFCTQPTSFLPLRRVKHSCSSKEQFIFPDKAFYAISWRSHSQKERITQVKPRQKTE